MLSVLHRPMDTNLPGAKPVRAVGTGAQLYLRTTRHAYTVYLRTRATCRCAAEVGILDETLFDLESDAAEVVNLAYDPVHAQRRNALLQTVLRDWQLHDLVPAAEIVSAPNRSARAAQLELMASCFNFGHHEQPGCHTRIGRIRG